MSAIVAALNGHAAAIAADSAVTIGGRKVFNSANKIFTLSKYAPVAIAIYNNTSLINIPWEIIIKEYRKYLSDNKKSNLCDYANDFFEFIKDKDYFSDVNKQKIHLAQAFLSYLDVLANEIDLTASDINVALKKRLNKLEDNHSRPLECFNHISKDDFINNNRNEIQLVINEFNRKHKCTVNENIISNILYHVFVCAQWQVYSTGLVFIGYGEDELFPSLYSFETCFIVNGCLSIRHLSDNDAIIQPDHIDAAVRPFAQTDVMDTILRGISPQVKDIFIKNYSIPIVKVFDDIARIVEAGNPSIASNIRDFIKNNLPNYQEFYFKKCNELALEEYISPFINSVITLDKEDLADFVESLIKLTSLKRKISPDQPTVGGPIDVMVISKGDGIIWMKRKHYFNPELNNHFFHNYFRQ